MTSVRGAPIATRPVQRLRPGGAWEPLIVARPLSLLAGITFASHVRTGGLYYDDWSALATQRYPAHSGWLGAVYDYIAGGAFVSRPGMAVLLAVTNAALGADGSAHLDLTLLLAVLTAVVFFAFLRAVGLGAVHAAVMASLVLRARSSTRVRRYLARP